MAPAGMFAGGLKVASTLGVPSPTANFNKFDTLTAVYLSVFAVMLILLVTFPALFVPNSP